LAGTLSKLQVRVSSYAWRTSVAYRYTVMRNGAATDMQCQLSVFASSWPTCADASHTLAFNEGDTISLRAERLTGDPPGDTVVWSALYG
jgi:hypothetical protein